MLLIPLQELQIGEDIFSNDLLLWGSCHSSEHILQKKSREKANNKTDCHHVSSFLSCFLCKEVCHCKGKAPGGLKKAIIPTMFTSLPWVKNPDHCAGGSKGLRATETLHFSNASRWKEAPVLHYFVLTPSFCSPGVRYLFHPALTCFWVMRILTFTAHLHHHWWRGRPFRCSRNKYLTVCSASCFLADN